MRSGQELLVETVMGIKAAEACQGANRICGRGAACLLECHSPALPSGFGIKGALPFSDWQLSDPRRGWGWKPQHAPPMARSDRRADMSDSCVAFHGEGVSCPDHTVL